MSPSKADLIYSPLWQWLALAISLVAFVFGVYGIADGRAAGWPLAAFAVYAGIVNYRQLQQIRRFRQLADDPDDPTR